VQYLDVSCANWGWLSNRVREAYRTLELLLEAGYRPTLYRSMPPPAFHGILAEAEDKGVRAVLDPFDFLQPQGTAT